MLEIIENVLSDFASSNWSGFRAALAKDAVYEEIATRQRAVGAEQYVRVMQRWKAAYPDMRAKIEHAFESDRRVIVEVEWAGTQNGKLEFPFGSIPPTNKSGTLKAAIVFELEDGKIISCRHYFDLVTILAQLGMLPAIGTVPQPREGVPSPQPRH